MRHSETCIALAFNPDTPWLKEVFPGIVRYAEEQKTWRLAFLHPDSAPDSAMDLSGVLTAGTPGNQALLEKPVVFFTPQDHPHVATDNIRAGAMACGHLIERGYQTLLFFQTGDIRDSVPFLREQGFRQTAKEAGRTVTTFNIGSRTRKRKKWTLEDQMADLGGLLTELPKPIGATACNPDHIQRLHSVCGQFNLRIPEDVGIVSPTESTVILPYLDPGISSVHHDRERIGFEAARLLHLRMQGKNIPDATLIPPKEIIVRGSTDHRNVGDPLCGKIVNYIWDHLEDAPTTAELAERFHLSERTLYRRFEEHVGRTPSEELRHARIETAKRLLQTTSLPLIDIALECGYGGQSQFNRDFKRATGSTPGSMGA
jgi:LacI family transcriptional regulator